MRIQCHNDYPCVASFRGVCEPNSLASSHGSTTYGRFPAKRFATRSIRRLSLVLIAASKSYGRHLDTFADVRPSVTLSLVICKREDKVYQVTLWDTAHWWADIKKYT